MNVTIRPLQEQDAYTSVKWRNDPEVFKYTGNTYKNEILLETELAWIKKVMHNENEYRCAILVEETYVGNIYLTDIAEGKANYHIFIGNKDFWGKGVAKKASELIIEHAFETLQLNEIHLRVKKLNDRALNLYKSLGFSIDSEDDEWISMSKYRVMVSILCLVYNHEPYLRQCLDGFVMQKTNFKFEAIVHDDASTDGSAAIIREYAEKYPDIIKPIFETENQYSKHDGALTRIMNNHMRGKYIAFCEGDDYWIDESKLQNQVDILESKSDIKMVYSKCLIFFEKTKKFGKKEFGGPGTSFLDLLKLNTIPTHTVVIHKDILLNYYNEIKPEKRNWVAGDLPIWLWTSQKYKIFFQNKTVGVYRYMESSASHSNSLEKDLRFKLGMVEIKDFFKKNYGIKIDEKEHFISTSLLKMKSYALHSQLKLYFGEWKNVIKKYFFHGLFEKRAYAYLLLFISKTLRTKHS